MRRERRESRDECTQSDMELMRVVQVIIEKAYEGNKDHIRGALDLFVDFMAIFVSF